MNPQIKTALVTFTVVAVALVVVLSLFRIQNADGTQSRLTLKKK